MKKLVFIFILALYGCLVARGEELLKYGFGSSEATGVLTPTETANHVTGLAFSAGTGLTDVEFKDGDGADGACYTAQNWENALNNTKYFQFGVQVEGGYTLDLASVSLKVFKKSGKGPDRMLIRYSLDGVTFNDYASDVSADYEDIWHLSTVSEIVSGLSGTVYFRIYGYEAGAPDKRWRIDDVTVNGTVYSGTQNPPVIALDPAGLEHTLEVGQRFELLVTATESDGDIVKLESKNLPAGAVFIPSQLIGAAPLQQMFYWTPSQAGDYQVVFGASDDDGTNRVDLTLHVMPEQSDIAMIVNEYNGVSGDKFLGSDFYAQTNCADAYFGRIVGNGKNWVELVVVEDHADLRGWQLRWAEPGDPMVDPESGETLWESTGEDLWYGEANGVNGVIIKQGIVEFSDSDYWSDLRAGTIITIMEAVTVTNQWGIECLNGSDLSYNPRSGDWWIHISTLDEAASSRMVMARTNIDGDDLGEFGVGNDDWEMSIYDSEGNRNFGPVGEAIPGWGGGSASGNEGVMAIASPQDIFNSVYYDDTKWTTFGSTNRWDDGTDGQDFDNIREDAMIPPVFKDCGNPTAYTGELFTFTFELDNTDGDDVSMQMLSGPSGATFAQDGDRGTLQWLPENMGTFPVTVSASDLDGSSQKTLSIYVEAAPSQGTYLLNEIFANPIGEDGNREYVEIRGPANGSLNGLVFLMVDSGGASIGKIRMVRYLSGYNLGANGLLLLGRNYETYPPYTNVPSETLMLNLSGDEEISDEATYFLVGGFSGSLDDDLDENDDGILDVHPWSVVYDSVGLGDALEAYKLYSTARLLVGDETPDAASRLPDMDNASDYRAWYFGGTTEEAGDSYGLVYKTKDASSNLPEGARLTPGGINVSAENGGDVDGDSMPDEWEIAMFGNRMQTAAGDFDQDGLSNYAEYICGTDPTDGMSALGFESGAFTGFQKGSGPADNLLRNTGFEDTGSSADYAAYWQADHPNDAGACWGNSGRRQWDVKHSGNACAILTGEWLAFTNVAGMLQKVACDPGDQFEASAWLYRESAWSFPTVIKLEYINSALQVLHAITNDLSSIPANSWCTSSVNGTAPAGTAFAQVVVEASSISGNPGTFYVDDVSLVEADNTESFVMSWNAVTGRLYHVDWRSDLLTGEWTPLDGAQSLYVDENDVLSIQDDFNPQMRRLYRLNVELP